MKLSTLLTAPEMVAFHALLQEAAQAGAGAIRFHSCSSKLAVIGILDRGELLTWYASPAQGEAEALLVQTVVLNGMAHTAAAVAQSQSVAAEALRNAKKH